MAEKKSVDISKDKVPAEGEGEPQKSDKSKEEVNLTDEQWEIAFKSPRFAELLKKTKETEKKLQEYEMKEQEEKDAKLKKEGKLQELLEKKEARIKELEGSFSKIRIEYEVKDKANKLGIIDTDVAAKLIDFGKIEVDESGNPKNIDALLTELTEQKPYLVGKGEKASVGSGANTSTENQGAKPIWAQSELREKLQDHAWYKEHQEEIESAQREGRIDPTK